MTSKPLTLAGALILLPGLVYGHGVALTAKIGTLGLGAQATMAFSPSFTARAGINGYNYSADTVQSGIDYHAKLKLNTFSLLGDWYPFDGAFRATFGLMYNRNEGDLTARPNNGQFVINGVSYAATDVGTLYSKVTFKKIAPYFGIGWGNPAAAGKGWGMTADVGVLYQGTPQASLTAVCGSGINALICAQLQSDTQQEQAQLNADINKYKWYPVVSVGVSYRF